MASNTKYSKEDLRRIMKAKMASTNKIESPIAIYDSTGNLSCRVCSSRVSEMQWTVHVLSKDHKAKVEALKALKLKESMIKEKSASKRTLNEAQLIESSPLPMRPTLEKSDNKRMRTQDLSKRDLVTKLEQESESMQLDTQEEEGKECLKHSVESEKKKESCLPKGFFDDPEADAKARSVAFVDPVEEEYAQFQRLIANEATQSENMVQEDLESIQQEKTVEEIEDQMNKWRRIDSLEQQLKVFLSQRHKPTSCTHKHEEEDEDQDIDDDNLSSLLDWRTKGGFK